MWLICGTVPDETFPLTDAAWMLEGEQLRCLDTPSLAPLAVRRGTPALIAAAVSAANALQVEPPRALLVGDVGTGSGSNLLYQHLAAQLRTPSFIPKGLTFHYLFPNLDGHNHILMALEERTDSPLLVADAGFMYVAKMSGYASRYDLFTPDAGELAFLADEHAPHPFYTRGFLLDAHDSVPALTARAYLHDNAAHTLLIKGEVDYVAEAGHLIDSIAEPCIPFMEPIGGTGDFVTGLVTAFLIANYSLPQASRLAARANRELGKLANPTPATPVSGLLPFVEQGVQRALEWESSCARC